jgi:hypothetical protein
MGKLGRMLNGKKTIIGSVISLATLAFAAATGQDISEVAHADTLDSIITLVGAVTGGGFLSVGVGHKFAKAGRRDGV